MSERVRTIAARLRGLIGNRRYAKRRTVRLPCSVSLVDRRTGANGSSRPRSLAGHTLDISTTGMSLIVPAIRIGERYLVGDSRKLQIKLELPSAPIDIQAAPVRYERLEEHEVETGYLIGVRVTGMSEQDQAQFKEYVDTLISS